jgi:hypothetical protein
MISCYLFHGQITTDTVEMKLLATMTCEVYCTTVHFVQQYIQTANVHFTALGLSRGSALKEQSKKQYR